MTEHAHEHGIIIRFWAGKVAVISRLNSREHAREAADFFLAFEHAEIWFLCPLVGALRIVPSADEATAEALKASTASALEAARLDGL